jgi:hypothetical protein
MMLKYFVLLFTLFLGQIAMAQPAANLVTNGDFETAAPTNPPTGWAMWGGDKGRDPANYTRDETVAHSGKASLRIAHPSNTDSFIVTDPKHAIPTQANQRYTVSFWARADKAGTAKFVFDAYESMTPLKSAPTPGNWNISVTPEWKRYEYSIDEGWELFADRTKYLMLAFRAANRDADEQTLWLDDVVVTAQPSPLKGRLIDERTLAIPPLPHRLQPGDKLDVTIDTKNVVRPATRMAGGISWHRLSGFTAGQPFNAKGEYTLNPKLEEAIRELRLPMTRIYALATEEYGVEGAIDRAHELVRRIGVAETDTVLELEPIGARTKIDPEVWVRAVRYSKSKGYKFRYWEIGNEVYTALHHKDVAFPTPQDYVAHIKAVSAAIRAVDPQAKIGLSMASFDQKWGSGLMMQAAGAYDFVCPHYYAGGDVTFRPFEEIVLAENYRSLNRIQTIGALLQAYNPGREVYQLDTEWGLHGYRPGGGVADDVLRNANIHGVLHRAVRLIYYGREGMLRGASSWQMLSSTASPGFGILSPDVPEKRFMHYWLYYYWNRHLGSDVLSMNGTTPFYISKDTQGRGPSAPMLATRSADGKQIFIVMANGSWQNATPSRIRLQNTRVNGVMGTILSSPDPNASPLVNKTEDFVQPFTAQHTNNELNFTLPPHSVVFLTLNVG